MYAIINTHTGKIRLKNSNYKYINEAKKGDILTFKLKKQAKKFISDNNAWALAPIRIKEEFNKWKGVVTNYRFDINV